MKIFISHEMGSIYWIENGKLMFAPLINSATEPYNLEEGGDGGEVDFVCLKGEEVNGKDVPNILRNIERKLWAAPGHNQ